MKFTKQIMAALCTGIMMSAAGSVPVATISEERIQMHGSQIRLARMGGKAGKVAVMTLGAVLVTASAYAVAGPIWRWWNGKTVSQKLMDKLQKIAGNGLQQGALEAINDGRLLTAAETQNLQNVKNAVFLELYAPIGFFGLFSFGINKLANAHLLGIIVPFIPGFASNAWQKHVTSYEKIRLFATTRINLFDALQTLKEQAIYAVSAQGNGMYADQEFGAFLADWDDCVSRFEQLLGFMDYHLQYTAGVHQASGAAARQALKRELDRYSVAIAKQGVDLVTETITLERIFFHALATFELALKE
ncbi:hypothetical protein HOL34_01130 [bacterium]|jgi:hypothetical protein|nr:hypothetical protein [bacterium]MBT3903723.1 hypothetical protein [bacterium]MBT4577738.1 hypothetical protein [bacterium]MBT5346061.1 hypothetical protein [bacterium]MBT6131313.1 hypothetical protein [bacterium]